MVNNLPGSLSKEFFKQQCLSGWPFLFEWIVLTQVSCTAGRFLPSEPPGKPRVCIHSTILEWVALSSSRKSSQPWDWMQVSCITRWFFIAVPPRKHLVNAAKMCLKQLSFRVSARDWESCTYNLCFYQHPYEVCNFIILIHKYEINPSTLLCDILLVIQLVTQGDHNKSLLILRLCFYIVGVVDQYWLHQFCLIYQFWLMQGLLNSSAEKDSVGLSEFSW